MKAISVEVSLMTRVIVPDDFNVDDLRDEDYKTLREKALPRLKDILETDMCENLGEIKDDEEVPFGELDEDQNEV